MFLRMTHKTVFHRYLGKYLHTHKKKMMNGVMSLALGGLGPLRITDQAGSNLDSQTSTPGTIT